jgi:FixJ family two-component response regulator
METAMPEITPIVFVVDNDESVSSQILSWLGTVNLKMESFENAHDFLARPPANGPCCLVLDTSLPGLSGLDLQVQLAQEREEMPVIFATSCGDIALSVRAMKAGAVEFLTKPIDAAALVKAVVDAIGRSRAALARKAELHKLRKLHDSLTTREKQVLALIVAGRLNKQVGGELGISEITVKAHRGKVMRKMQTNSLAELVLIAARLDLDRSPTPYHPDARRAPSTAQSMYR